MKRICAKCGFYEQEDIMEKHKSGKWYCQSCASEVRCEVKNLLTRESEISEIIEVESRLDPSWEPPHWMKTANAPTISTSIPRTSELEVKQILLRLESKVDNLQKKLPTKAKTEDKSTQTEKLEAKMEVKKPYHWKKV